MSEVFKTLRLEAAVAERGATLSGAQPLAGDGSDRRFFRLLGSPTVVLLFHPHPPGGEVNENDSYYQVGRHLRAKGGRCRRFTPTAGKSSGCSWRTWETSAWRPR
jgi:hypothetical protein